MELKTIINTLLADEISAWWMYWFMYQVAKGPAYHAIEKELEELAEDELNDHAVKLITWAQSNNIEIEVMPKKLFELSQCPIKNFSDGISTSKVLIINILAERCAIKSYKKYYDVVKDSYPDLAHLFMEISIDEQEHLNKLLDLGAQLKLPSEILDGTSLSGLSDYNSISDRIKSLF